MFSVYLHSHAKPLQPFQNTFIHCDFSGSSFKYVRVCCKLRKRPRGHVSVFVSVSCNVYVVFHVGAVVSWSDCSIIELVPFISQPRWCVTQGLLRSADHFFKELGKLVFSAFLFSPHFWLVGVFFCSLLFVSSYLFIFITDSELFRCQSLCIVRYLHSRQHKLAHLPYKIRGCLCSLLTHTCHSSRVIVMTVRLAEGDAVLFMSLLLFASLRTTRRRGAASQTDKPEQLSLSRSVLFFFLGGVMPPLITVSLSPDWPKRSIANLPVPMSLSGNNINFG